MIPQAPDKIDHLDHGAEIFISVTVARRAKRTKIWFSFVDVSCINFDYDVICQLL